MPNKFAIFLTLPVFLLAGISPASGNFTSHTWNALAKQINTTLPALTAGNNVITTGFDIRDWLETVSISLGTMLRSASPIKMTR